MQSLVKIKWQIFLKEDTPHPMTTLALTTPLQIGSLASDPVSPSNGLFYYNTSDNTIHVYQGGSWTTVSTGGGGGGTLQDAYLAGGGQITTDVGNGPLNIYGTEGLQITGQKGIFLAPSVYGNIGLQILNGDANAIWAYTTSASSTDYVVYVEAANAASGISIKGIAATDYITFRGSSSGTLGIQIPATVSPYFLTLPSANGTTGQVLSLSDNVGTLAWSTAGGPYSTVSATVNFVSTPTDGSGSTLNPTGITLTAGQIVVSIHAEIMAVTNAISTNYKFTTMDNGGGSFTQKTLFQTVAASPVGAKFTAFTSAGSAAGNGAQGGLLTFTDGGSAITTGSIKFTAVILTI